MADDSISQPFNPLPVPVAPSPDVSQLPVMSQQGPPAPDVSSPQAVAQNSQQSGSQLPGVAGLIANLLRPPLQNQNGQLRPASRAREFESFLGNFMQSLGAGMAASGHGPGANIRGAGAAIQEPMQRAGFQSQLAAQQAQTAQTQQQTAQMPLELQARMATLSQQPRFDSTGKYLGVMNDTQYTQYLRGMGGAIVKANAPQPGVPITPDMAQEFPVLGKFVGQSIKARDFAAIAADYQATGTTERRITTDPQTGMPIVSDATITRGPKLSGGGTPVQGGGKTPSKGTPSGFPNALPKTDLLGYKIGQGIGPREVLKRQDDFKKNADDLAKTEGTFQQFNNILADVNAGKDMTGAQSVVGLFNAIGISATPLKGMGFRINNNTIQEHAEARGLGDSLYQKLLNLKAGDVITPQQLKDYATLATQARESQYINLANQAHNAGIGADFVLPQGNRQKIDPSTAKIFFTLAGGDPVVARRAATAKGWVTQ